VFDVDQDADAEVEVLSAAYGPLGYAVSRTGDGSLRAAHPGPPPYTVEAGTAAGLRKSIIERETGRGLTAEPYSAATW
jgi:hypothetical protein